MPVESVPMKSPATMLPVVPESEMYTPLGPLPEMTLPVPATVPPIVLLLAPAKMATPLCAVAQARGAAGGDADVIALDHVAGGPAADDLDAIPMCCPR